MNPHPVSLDRINYSNCILRIMWKKIEPHPPYKYKKCVIPLRFTFSQVLLSVLQVGGSAPDPDLSRPGDCGRSNRTGAILLQMLDFKTHLQEAAEELHTRRVQPARAGNSVLSLKLQKLLDLGWSRTPLLASWTIRSGRCSTHGDGGRCDPLAAGQKLKITKTLFLPSSNRFQSDQSGGGGVKVRAA